MEEIKLKERDSASVLIIVLWMVTGLVAVALYFAHDMVVELKTSDNQVAGTQAEHAIEGVAKYVRYTLTNATQTPRELRAEDTFNREFTVGVSRAWLIGRPQGTDPTSATSPTWGLLDEASKINLNTATREMLEALPHMTPELAASIIDWRDEDNELTPDGAESQYYLLEEPAYECKNAPFDTIDELRLVAGATHERLYGEDWNRNGILDPNENDGDALPPPDDHDGILDFGIVEYVTVYSRNASQTEAGEERVNINEDRDEGLQDLLETTFGSDRAEEILQQLDEDEEYSSLLTFFSESGMTIEEFDQIASQIFLGDSGNQQPRINVNTGSRVVLQCIPGIDSALAEQLLQHRASQGELPQSEAWITEVLDEEALAEAGPFITGEGGPYTMDIAAVGRMGKGYRRVRFVVEAGSTHNTILHRQDFGELGWALGTEVRNRLNDRQTREQF